MGENTEALIDRLAREATPVKPLWPPFLRAGLLVAAVLAAMGAIAAYAGDAGLVAQLSDMPFAAGFVGALITGVSAVIAAVMMAIPGRGQAWMYLPLPGALLWLLGSGIECYRYVEAFGLGSQSVFESMDCFTFIVSAGVPTAAAIFAVLRRTVSIHLFPVTALAGLGAAMLAAALLQLLHAHGASPADFGAHAVAVVTLILFMITVGRLALRRV